MSSPRLTVEQLERMRTHELADLLANVVMVLRRMPDVECRALGSALPEPAEEPTVPAAPAETTPLPLFSAAELKGKTVPELRKLAAELHIPSVSKAKKEELMTKILARQKQGHSEQFAIQNL